MTVVFAFMKITLPSNKLLSGSEKVFSLINEITAPK